MPKFCEMVALDIAFHMSHQAILHEEILTFPTRLHLRPKTERMPLPLQGLKDESHDGSKENA